MGFFALNVLKPMPRTRFHHETKTSNEFCYIDPENCIIVAAASTGAANTEAIGLKIVLNRPN